MASSKERGRYESDDTIQNLTLAKLGWLGLLCLVVEF